MEFDNILRQTFNQEKGYNVEIDADNVTQANNIYILWLEHKLEKYKDELYFFIAIVYVKFLIKKIKTYFKSINKTYFKSINLSNIKVKLYLPKIKLPKVESRFTKLINSDRYKKSEYVIEKINNNYAIRKKNTIGTYIDLRSPAHSWETSSNYFKDCLGSKDEVIEGFDFLVPIIKPMVIKETY